MKTASLLTISACCVTLSLLTSRLEGSDKYEKLELLHSVDLFTGGNVGWPVERTYYETRYTSVSVRNWKYADDGLTYSDDIRIVPYNATVQKQVLASGRRYQEDTYVFKFIDYNLNSELLENSLDRIVKTNDEYDFDSIETKANITITRNVHNVADIPNIVGIMLSTKVADPRQYSRIESFTLEFNESEDSSTIKVDFLPLDSQAEDPHKPSFKDVDERQILYFKKPIKMDCCDSITISDLELYDTSKTKAAIVEFGLVVSDVRPELTAKLNRLLEMKRKTVDEFDLETIDSVVRQHEKQLRCIGDKIFNTINSLSPEDEAFLDSLKD